MNVRSAWRWLSESKVTPIALLVVFAGLVAITITRFSVWIDESATLELVGRNGYREILSDVRFDTHPPLWYLILKPWLEVFGTHVLAARSQSAVFMLAAFWVWYHFLRTRFSRPIALVGLALMVTNPMLLHYAVEGRMYAFGILLVAISCVNLTSEWRWRWVAYWLCAVTMLWVHYFLAFVIVGEFLYLLLRRRERGVSSLWIILYGASIVAAFAPWLPHAFHMTSAAVTHGFWIKPILPTTILGYVLHAFLHRLEVDLTDAALFLTLIYLAAWMAALVRAGRASGGSYALLWFVMALPPLCLLALSCKPLIPIFHPRYVIFGLPALIALLAAGALSLTGRWRPFVIAVLIVGNLAGIRTLRDHGFHDIRGFWAMKQIAKEVSKPIDGEVPLVVATWLFTFFDARATLDDSQQVVELRSTLPLSDSIPDVIYVDRPDWYILSLSEVHARHVWLLEDATQPRTVVPPGWKLEVTHNRGYARTSLFSIPGA